MAYAVEFSERADLDLQEIWGRINAEESASAQLWFRRLVLTIHSLGETPRMGTPTPEDPEARQFIYGKKPHFYRIIYDVDDVLEIVNILHIRHGRRQRFVT